MIKIFGMIPEDKKKMISSVKKYIAAGVSAAAFIVCAAVGAANTAQPETIPAETDVIPTETAAAEAVCSAQADIDVLGTVPVSGTLSVNAAAFPYEEGSSEEEAVNTAVPETEAEEQEEETVTAAEPVPEEEDAENVENNINEDDTDNEEDTYDSEDEIFCEDAEVPTGSFADETVTSAKVKSVEAKTSEKVNVRVVAPEMSPYSDEEYSESSYGSEAAADESEQENEESSADEEEIFADEQGSATPVDPEAVERVSKFDIPEWLELDENGVPTQYTEAITGKSCAYTAEPDALMSTGKPVFQGYVAVDPDIIPYGSELYIIAEDGEVYGYAIAADTGYSVRKGHIIVDLFMDEYDDCIQWGAKNVTIYVLRTNEDNEGEE